MIPLPIGSLCDATARISADRQASTATAAMTARGQPPASSRNPRQLGALVESEASWASANTHERKFGAPLLAVARGRARGSRSPTPFLVGSPECPILGAKWEPLPAVQCA
jgi:hypothetical protein